MGLVVVKLFLSAWGRRANFAPPEVILDARRASGIDPGRRPG